MKSIVILGGGEAGFYTALGLERELHGQARTTLVDIRSHMVYQPFLAEVASGSIEPRHIQVPFHQHLRKTEIVCARVMGISSAEKIVHLENMDGDKWDLPYDILVVTLGGVVKTFPTPGIAEHAIGLKSVEEAVHIRNKIITNFNRVSSMYPDNPNRKRLLTFVVVGGGFSGIEVFAEMHDLAQNLLQFYPNVNESELEFHLIEAADRIMPEMPRERSAWVVKQMEERGAHVHLSTRVVSAVDGVVRTSEGKAYETEVIVWTAGQRANPVLQNSDLPLDSRGRLRCGADLRVEGDDGIVKDVWGAGDACNVPDLSGDGLPDGSCAPTAQHAMRQAHLLVRNIIADLNGRTLLEYRHANAGMVAGLGMGLGVFTDGSKQRGINGFVAWMFHRAYHGLAVPTVERKVRVVSDWFRAFVVGRDFTATSEFAHPRALFEEYAAPMRPEEKPVPQTEAASRTTLRAADLDADAEAAADDEPAQVDKAS